MNARIHGICAAALCLAGIATAFFPDLFHTPPATAGEPTTQQATTNASATLTVRITGFRNDQGFARASLFTSPDGFPSDAARAHRSQSASITNQQAVLVFTNLPPGGYAAAILHDENANGRMDTNWLGIPREGYGASNNARGRMGPPDFAAAGFTLTPPTQILTIAVTY